MKRWILTAAALCVLAVPDAQAGALYVQVGGMFTFQNNLSYNADAWYSYDFLDFRTANVWGVCNLAGSGQPDQYFGPIPGHPDMASGSWTFSGTHGSYYRVYATATEDINDTMQSAGSHLLYAGWQPPYYTLKLWANMDGALYRLRDERFQEGTWLTLSPDTPQDWRFTGWSGYMDSQTETISFHMPAYDIEVTGNYTFAPPPDREPESGQLNYGSPIVINLGDGGYQLSGIDDPVTFDMKGTGTPVHMTWTAQDSEMSFLALDRNGDGVVSNGREMFGNYTPLPSGFPAANGFDALRQYDLNGDRILDARDSIWPSLLLWADRNHDGISQLFEIVRLSESIVAAIGLDYHWTGRRDSSGNAFRYQSKVWLHENGGFTPRPLYDIFFVYVP